MNFKASIRYAWTGLVLPLQIASAAGGIATDGTMGAAQILSGANVTIPQTLGATDGHNLFHSFSEFNIANGQTVEFAGGNTLQNVISRVTGTDATDIEGTLKSSIANAAFYFINPNGITFGANAQVDVPGAFHVGAADKITFPNNGVFYADSNRTSSLSSATPTAFGFLETSAATNGLLEVDGAQLAVRPKQTLAMSGRQISIENFATLSAPSGEIRLEAVDTGESQVSLDAPPAAVHGTVKIASSTLNASGDGAGKLTVRGGEVNVIDSDLLANNTGSTDTQAGRGVDITADNLNVTASSRIHANVFGHGRGADINIAAAGGIQVDDSIVRAAVLPGANGHGGNITVNAKNIGIDGSANGEAAINVLTAPNAAGATGSVDITAEEQLTLLNKAYISADTYGAADAHAINISAQHINLDSGAEIESSAWGGSTGNAGHLSVHAGAMTMDNSASLYSITWGTGKAGNVRVESAGLLNMLNGASIENSARDGSTGDTGDVDVKAGAMNMANNAWIFSTTLGAGKAANLTVESTGLLNMINGASIQNFALSGLRNAGHVSVTAGGLTLDGLGAGVTGISSNTLSSGKAGNVTVNSAGALDIVNGAIIASNTGASGDAGNVNVKAGSLTIDGGGKQSGIYSDTFFGSGGSGTVSVASAGALNIANGGIIGTLTTASGDAGNVNVKAGSLDINAQNNDSSNTGIYSGPAFSCADADMCTGKAGAVNVESVGVMAIRNGGFISNNTFGAGDAGAINVKAGTLTMEGSDGTLTGIYANSFSSSAGKGGSIAVVSRGALSLLHGAVIDTSTFGTGKAGDIHVKADRLQVDGLRLNHLGFPDSSGIFSTATATSNGQAGNIDITAGNVVSLSNQGKISIENFGTAADPTRIRPGGITVSAPSIALKNGSIAADATVNVNAGAITVNFSHWLTMDTSYISTQAYTGNGGSITIGGGELIRLQNSGFFTTVYSGNGYGGDIIFRTADMLLMDNGLIQANAVGGSGGNITLNQDVLIPSGNTLILDGTKVNWRPFVPGFNVIQAASTFGVSGHVSITAPQLNLSGILANLGGPQFDTGDISEDYCGLGHGSSLTRQGFGGLKPKSGDLLFFKLGDCR